ncbi:Soluble NSF Attachment Protein (SNAP) Receptor (SNARE) [Ectocarpus siliculosus]|uniref:Soluble NSF Attachment Protein (SNAP) Receptor (SNARE) n=1 Tax=Ectocarpus siliculosus TaxID=2880 RepID=D8LE18_ECTSI|nr:Soluble NSF Attachment Protein (SNAP) Receptor (SNARE) [Ectocarpus siliculosus]|eukprot:CBN78535.1 Soluble NSF Attachment Protein (SNAP) Receptor (SNARE) [Ectocarpus siliculosus]
MAPSTDREVDLLLSKLRKIQAAVGGSDEERALRRKKRKSKEDDRFNAVKSAIIKRLGDTCDLLAKEPASKDPTAVIQKKNAVQSNLRALEENWKQLDSAYQAEKSKRRSKITREELENQRQLLVDLRHEIGELKSIHQAGVVGAKGGGTRGGYGTAMPASEFFKQEARTGGTTSVAEAPPPGKLTSEQHVRIQQIRDRKKEMEDKYLTVVEEHVDRLGEMAKNIQEELQIQDRMVDDLGNRIDTAQEHVANVNMRMKEVLKNVRSADKFCMDIMCILLLLGMIAVLYAVVKET